MLKFFLSLLGGLFSWGAQAKNHPQAESHPLTCDKLLPKIFSTLPQTKEVVVLIVDHLPGLDDPFIEGEEFDRKAQENWAFIQENLMKKAYSQILKRFPGSHFAQVLETLTGKGGSLGNEWPDLDLEIRFVPAAVLMDYKHITGGPDLALVSSFVPQHIEEIVEKTAAAARLAIVARPNDPVVARPFGQDLVYEYRKAPLPETKDEKGLLAHFQKDPFPETCNLFEGKIPPSLVFVSESGAPCFNVPPALIHSPLIQRWVQIPAGSDLKLASQKGKISGNSYTCALLVRLLAYFCSRGLSPTPEDLDRARSFWVPKALKADPPAGFSFQQVNTSNPSQVSPDVFVFGHQLSLFILKFMLGHGKYTYGLEKLIESGSIKKPEEFLEGPFFFFEEKIYQRKDRKEVVLKFVEDFFLSFVEVEKKCKEKGLDEEETQWALHDFSPPFYPEMIPVGYLENLEEVNTHLIDIIRNKIHFPLAKGEKATTLEGLHRLVDEKKAVGEGLKKKEFLRCVESFLVEMGDEEYRKVFEGIDHYLYSILVQQVYKEEEELFLLLAGLQATALSTKQDTEDFEEFRPVLRELRKALAALRVSAPLDLERLYQNKARAKDLRKGNP